MIGLWFFLGCYFAIGLFFAIGAHSLPLHQRVNLFLAWPVFVLEVLRK